MYWNLGVHCPLTGLWCSCLTRVRKHCHTDIKLWHRGGSSAANAGTKGTGWCWWRSCKTPWSIIPTSLENNSPSCPHLGVGLRCFSTLILNHWNTALAELKRRYKWASLHLWKRAKGSGIHSGLASKIHVCTSHCHFRPWLKGETEDGNRLLLLQPHVFEEDTPPGEEEELHSNINIFPYLWAFPF